MRWGDASTPSAKKYIWSDWGNSLTVFSGFVVCSVNTGGSLQYILQFGEVAATTGYARIFNNAAAAGSIGGSGDVLMQGSAIPAGSVTNNVWAFYSGAWNEGGGATGSYFRYNTTINDGDANTTSADTAARDDLIQIGTQAAEQPLLATGRVMMTAAFDRFVQKDEMAALYQEVRNWRASVLP